jgi:hypothetical protein
LTKQLAIISFVTGFLSMFGSAFIAFAVFYKGVRFKLSSTRDRLLLGMSCFDIISSFSLALGPIPSPSTAMKTAWAFGNEATCTAQGFGIQLGFAVPLYISSLCIYYVMVLVRHQDPDSINRIVELILHFVPLTFGFVTAIIGAASGIFNSDGRRCWVKATPWDCEWNDIIDCKNQNSATPYAIAFGVFPVFTGLSVIVVTMTAIILSVSCELRRQRQRQKDRNGPAAVSSGTLFLPVFVQACLYIFAFVITYTWLFPLFLGASTTFNHENVSKSCCVYR